MWLPIEKKEDEQEEEQEWKKRSKAGRRMQNFVMSLLLPLLRILLLPFPLTKERLSAPSCCCRCSCCCCSCSLYSLCCCFCCCCSCFMCCNKNCRRRQAKGQFYDCAVGVAAAAAVAVPAVAAGFGASCPIAATTFAYACVCVLCWWPFLKLNISCFLIFMTYFGLLLKRSERLASTRLHTAEAGALSGLSSCPQFLGFPRALLPLLLLPLSLSVFILWYSLTTLRAALLCLCAPFSAFKCNSMQEFACADMHICVKAIAIAISLPPLAILLDRCGWVLLLMLQLQLNAIKCSFCQTNAYKCLMHILHYKNEACRIVSCRVVLLIKHSFNYAHPFTPHTLLKLAFKVHIYNSFNSFRAEDRNT